MQLDKISPGNDIPNEINVIIEIPACHDPIKYEIDKSSGALFVDRFMATAMHYPANYGFVPNTLSEDGDPVDVLVLAPTSLMSGVVIPSRPIGVLQMTDEAGKDAKILAVPNDKLTPQYRHIHEPDDVSANLLAQIAHFFEHYKDLEEGKWVKVDGWAGADAAKAEIMASVERAG